MADDVKITFDTLFSLLRLEKSREELQELDSSFFNDVTTYLNEKKSLLSKETDGLSVFMDNEKGKTLKQIANIKKILNELYERREKKIVEMALVKSKTKSNVISDSAMLDTEKELFGGLVKIFDGFREGIIYNILEGKDIDLTKTLNIAGPSEAESAAAESADPSINNIKFLHDVPKFIGENLETYGPFEQGEVAELPSNIAELLLNKGRVEQV